MRKCPYPSARNARNALSAFPLQRKDTHERGLSIIAIELEQVEQVKSHKIIKRKTKLFFYLINGNDLLELLRYSIERFCACAYLFTEGGLREFEDLRSLCNFCASYDESHSPQLRYRNRLYCELVRRFDCNNHDRRCKLRLIVLNTKEQFRNSRLRTFETNRCLLDIR